MNYRISPYGREQGDSDGIAIIIGYNFSFCFATPLWYTIAVEFNMIGP